MLFAFLAAMRHSLYSPPPLRGLRRGETRGVYFDGLSPLLILTPGGRLNIDACISRGLKRKPNGRLDSNSSDSYLADSSVACA